MKRAESLEHKSCTACREQKPLADFQRRTGRKSGEQSRRGTCKACIKRKGKSESVAAVPAVLAVPAVPAVLAPLIIKAVQPKRSRPKPSQRPPGLPISDPLDASSLIPSRHGLIRMRGRTDKGHRWHQEIDLELAVTLVRERAAVPVNRHTIRRLFSNKDFRRYILMRDKHTCHFCGEYGDTIDHLLPRAKGGHTTPDNCVCACMICNQSKADRDLEEFVGAGAEHRDHDRHLADDPNLRRTYQ
ncbi:MAG: endonuclease [Cohnella sp.]|nr:endonuclease [Cohnella sp.]